MDNIINTTLDLGNGQQIAVETGRIARQADGAVWVRQGDTILLATVVAHREHDPKKGFLPLTVDYREHYSSTGKFPGGFFKRDGRPNEFETLTSRLIDRSLRPMFPDGYHAETQVIVTVFSADKEVQSDALATTAACCAIAVSDIPFPELVASVRVALIDGAYVVNPTFKQMERAEMDVMISGTADSIVMVEGEMSEVSEAQMLEAFQEAHAAIKRQVATMEQLRQQLGKTPRVYPALEAPEGLWDELSSTYGPRIKDIVHAPSAKHERSEAFAALKQEVMETYKAKLGDGFTDDHSFFLDKFLRKLQKQTMRRMILDQGKRLDGRRTDEVRAVWCEANSLPRVHGSSIFTRGETQSICMVTLGSKLDEQTIDYATQESTKKFMLQYIFPPYSTGEAKFLRGASRREIGHGNLAERALKEVIPTDNEYTIRVVSEITESNGSSSMATVCAGSLALMDAGIRLKGPVSGIAMGLIHEAETGEYAVLSDILGDEDFLGDMDFKVAGTPKGITACQMDIKIKGLRMEILDRAMDQAKAGRQTIMDAMLQALPEARQDVSKYAPRLLRMEIPSDFIGAVIGTGGKVIQEIQRVTGTTIAVEEEGKKGIITISSPDKSALDSAYDWIMEITTTPEVGTVLNARVTQVKEAGAVLVFGRGKEGWMHISEVAYERTPSMDEAVSVGDELEVKIIEIEPRTGKIRLSRKAMLPKPEGYEERESYDRPPRRDRGDRGDRGDRRGPRGDRGGDRGGSFGRGRRNDD